MLFFCVYRNRVTARGAKEGLGGGVVRDDPV